jgi:hypothetical protein
MGGRLGVHTGAASVICLSLAAFLFLTGCVTRPTTTATLPRLAAAVDDMSAAQRHLADARTQAKSIASLENPASVQGVNNRVIASLDLAGGAMTRVAELLKKRDADYQQIERQVEAALKSKNDAAFEVAELKSRIHKLQGEKSALGNEVKKLKVDWWLNRISAFLKIGAAGLLGIAFGVIGGPWIKKGLAAILKFSICLMVLVGVNGTHGGENYESKHIGRQLPAVPKIRCNEGGHQLVQVVPGMGDVRRGDAGVAGDRVAIGALLGDLRAGLHSQVHGVPGAAGGQHPGDHAAGALAVSDGAGVSPLRLPGVVPECGLHADAMGQDTPDCRIGGLPGGVAGNHPGVEFVRSTAEKRLGGENLSSVSRGDESKTQKETAFTPGATASPRDRFVAVLRSQVVVTEQPLGSNWGPQVSAYLAACGIKSPAPWCAAFLHWCLQQIGIGGAGAWSPSWFPKDRRITAATVQPGDIGGIYFLSLGRIGHVVPAIELRRREVADIEDNTNAAGSREGDRVAMKIRDKEQLVWARWLPAN